MKLLPILLLAISIVGCDENRDTGYRNVPVGSGLDTLEVHTVVIDGNEYYAVPGYGATWSFCPKLPAKKDILP